MGADLSTEASAKKGPHAKVPGIQFLRAVAVIAVIAFHMDHQVLPGGFVGVDIFFVISGFVITQSLLRRRQAGVLVFLVDFYSRRVRRIAPALLVFLATTSLLVALFVPRGFFLGGDGPATGMWAVFGLSNFSLLLSDRGYFDERIEFNAFSHTWSLGVEEQFYLIFPLLLWVLWNAAGRYRKSAKIDIVLAGLSFFIALSIGWAAIATASDPTAAFYLLPSRFWELGVGAALAVVSSRTNVFVSLGPRLGLPFLTIGTVLLGFSLVATTREGFPFPGALMPVVATALIIASFQVRSSKFVDAAHRFIEWRPFQIIGNWSYSLYLWHWGVFVLFRWTTGFQLWWHYLLALFLTFVLAGLSYRFIETPFLMPRKSFDLAPLKVVSAGFAVSLVWFGALWLGDRVAEPVLSQSVTARGEIFDPPQGTPDPEVEFSEYRGIGEARKLFAVGDSHARHYGTLLTEMRAVMGFEYEVIDDRDCPVASLIAPRGDCDEWETVVDRIANEAAPGDVVLLSSLRVPRLSSIVHGKVEEEAQLIASVSARDSSLIGSEARQAIRRLNRSDVFVVIPTPTPVFSAPAFRCLDWFNFANPVCEGGFSVDRELMYKLSSPANLIIHELENQGLATRWDIFPILCPEEVCRASGQGRYMFYDGDHLSRWGNYVLMESFVELIVPLWQGDPQGT